jgi:hypothetical protein
MIFHGYFVITRPGKPRTFQGSEFPQLLLGAVAAPSLAARLPGLLPTRFVHEDLTVRSGLSLEITGEWVKNALKIWRKIMVNIYRERERESGRMVKNGEYSTYN